MTLLRYEDIVLNSMTKSRVKWESLVLSRADFWMVWRCHGIPCFHFYVFCVEPNARKNNLMKATSVTFMTIFSEVSFWKLLDHSYVPSSFSTISMNIENGNWKTPYSWKSFRILINIALILSWVNIMKRKLTRKPGKLSVAQISEPVLQRVLY